MYGPMAEDARRLILARRIALMPISERFRECLESGLRNWMMANDPEKKEIRHLEMSVERHTDYDDLSVHLCTDDKALHERFAEEVVNPLMEEAHDMVYEALRENPIDIPHGEEGHAHEHEGQDDNQ